MSSENDIVKIYNDRYKHGYREELLGYELSRCSAIMDLCNNIMHFKKANEKILDYGSGSGAHVVLWEKIFQNPDLFFCDISLVALEKLIEKYPHYSGNISLISDNRTNFLNKEFDLIFSVEVMEHVLDLDAYLFEIFRLLKPGGFFIWTTPCGNKNSIEEIFSRMTKKIEKTPEGYIRWTWEDPTHLRRLTSEEISKKLTDVGFLEPQIFFRSHFFSFFITKIFIGPLVRYSHLFINLDWILFKKIQNGASMVGIVKKSDFT